MARTITMGRAPGAKTYRDEPSTAELDNLAHWLDSRFSIFGIRFGIESILGVIPGIGDIAGLGLSSVLVAQAWRLGARKRTLARMGLNVAADTVIGSIPVLGTVVDVMWKANRQNMRLLRRDIELGKARRRF